MPLLNTRRILPFALLAALTASHGELLVYEPFGYKPINDETHGRVAGRNSGMGFGAPWQDTQGDANEGEAFICDSRGNPKGLYGGIWSEGKVDWDGVIDNLPTMGGYAAISDWNSRDQLNSTRKLARRAGEMAKTNRGVLWLSAGCHFPDSGFFAPVGLALTSNDGGLDLTYAVWASSDLVTWTEDEGAVQIPDAPGANGTQTVDVSLSPELLANPSPCLCKCAPQTDGH